MIDDFYAKNHHHVSQLGYLQTTIYVYLPYINVIASEKAVLSEFEALLYLMENGNLDGIEYEEKEGMIEMMKKKYEKFTGDEKLIKEVDARYQVQYDFQEWHDYDVEYAKNEGIEQGHEQGLEEGHESEKRSMVKSLIEMTYSKEAPLWIDKCTMEQLDFLFSGIIQEHWEYEELKEKIFMN